MSKAIRLFKIGATSVLVLVAAVLLLAVWSLLFPPTYNAEAKLPGTELRIAVQLQPMHPYLAEYRRYLELRDRSAAIDSIELSSDTGGYSRTQLYALPEGEFLVLGYFDAVRVSTSPPAILEAEHQRPKHADYLGAFERDVTGLWRFADPSILPEEELEPQGG
jgi:hypothetical protein